MCGLIILLQACSANKKNEEQKEEAIARVFDKYLYPSELKNIVPGGINGKDSTELINNYINKWIEEELVLQYAERNLSDEQKDIEKQIEEYKKNLLIYTYQTELVRQKLDTGVTAEEITNYYQEHEQEFTLKNNIVKVYYVKLNHKAPNIEKLRKWYISENPKDIDALRSYCIQFAENSFIDDNTWILFDDLLKEVPLQEYNPELFLKGNKTLEFSDSAHVYFLNIKGFKIKNNTSPLSFEIQNIRNIIINKRKLKLVDDMKKQLYLKAKDAGSFEVYNNNVKK